MAERKDCSETRANKGSYCKGVNVEPYFSDQGGVICTTRKLGNSN